MTDEEFVRSVYPNIQFFPHTIKATTIGDKREVQVLHAWDGRTFFGKFSVTDKNVWRTIREKMERKLLEAFQA